MENDAHDKLMFSVKKQARKKCCNMRCSPSIHESFLLYIIISSGALRRIIQDSYFVTAVQKNKCPLFLRLKRQQPNPLLEMQLGWHYQDIPGTVSNSLLVWARSDKAKNLNDNLWIQFPYFLFFQFNPFKVEGGGGCWGIQSLTGTMFE